MTLILLRQNGWRVRLAAALDATGEQPHQWGSHDCFLSLAGGVVEAITSADIVAPYRGRYSSREEALNVLRSEGCNGLDELIETILPPIGRGDARLGDLAFVPDGSELGGFLGVFGGERIVCLGLAGKTTLPRTAATRAFMVGG
jgi:hypothetical protein